jgi:hypothetical protein
VEHEKEEKTLLKRRYRLAVELVDLLRQYGFFIYMRCPKCGAEGTLTTLVTRRYIYLVVRHPNKYTHTISKPHVGEVLCRIEQVLAHILVQILEIYKKHTNGDVKLCDREGNFKLTQPT